MKKPIQIVPNFFDEAEELRKYYNLHFENANEHHGEQYQVWNYWYIPDLYTYFRTTPTRIFPVELVDNFVSSLQTWAIQNLGLSQVAYPTLSLYVNGCGQGLHNDSGNGRWGFVYSLTRWDERKFQGGETLIFKDTPYWETSRIKYPDAGVGFYDLVPAQFNQLLVFDDHLIHAVRPIQGNMDPLQGRVVLHGHISEGGLQVMGALTVKDIEQAILSMKESLYTQFTSVANTLHGCISFRIIVSANGSIEQIDILNDRIYRTNTSSPDPEKFTNQVKDLISQLKFPVTTGRSQIILPFKVGYNSRSWT